VPALKTLKTWLETNAGKVAKGTLTRTAMDYTLNQWPTLVGYCERGDLQISVSDNKSEPTFRLTDCTANILEMMNFLHS
jgi:hypothetical protein